MIIKILINFLTERIKIKEKVAEISTEEKETIPVVVEEDSREAAEEIEVIEEIPVVVEEDSREAAEVIEVIEVIEEIPVVVVEDSREAIEVIEEILIPKIDKMVKPTVLVRSRG
jgi:hypothetical protein